VNPDVPVEIAEIVHGCLEKSPNRRFANAGEVLGTLDRASGSVRSLPTSGRTRGVPAGRTRGIPAGGRAAPPGRSAAAAAARKRSRNLKMSLAYVLPVVALLLLVAIPGTRGAISSLLAPRAAEAHPFVAVIPTTASNADDNATAEGLTHTLTGALARLGRGPDSLRVVPSSEILNQGVGTAVRAHELFGVNRVVSVAVVRAGVAGIQLVLQDPNRPQLGQLASVDLPMPDDAAFFDELAGALVELLGLSAGSRLAEAVEEQRPASPTAFNFTVLGRGKLQQGYNIPSQLDAAIQLFENALGEDPDYAPALAGLCEALFEKGRRTNDPAYRRDGLDQCARARESGADQVAVLVPLAAVYLQTGEVDRAEDALRAAIELDSTSADAHRWLARVHEQKLEDEDARAEYLRAIELEPGMWVYHNEFGTFLALRDLHGEALRHFDQVRMLAPDNYLGDLGRSYSLIQLGRTSEARGVLERLVREHGVDRAYSNLGYLHLREGRYGEAVAVLEQGLARYERDWWLHRWLAHAAHWAGNEARARRAWSRIVELTTEGLEFNPNEQDLLIGLAEAHAQLGDPGAAREFLADARREPIRWSYNVYYVGRVYEMLNDRDAALTRIGEAIERGYDLDTIEDDPWLDDLRADPDFADIRALEPTP
jgi:tetratricopeptide (TPR) repeat protein